jgi:hypothetical protein
MNNVIFYESQEKLYVFQNGGLWWTGPGSFTMNNLTCSTYVEYPSVWPVFIVGETNW